MNTYYFAYGSNMSSKRLLARLPRAEKVGVAVLRGHRIGFDKVGMDGSGKCTVHISERTSDAVYGVVYRISHQEKQDLDKIEGPRYDQHDVRVEVIDGIRLDAYCYIANTLDSVMLPFDWYLEHVYQGALEAELPDAYIDEIRRQASLEDPDSERAEHEFAIHRSENNDK